MTVRLNKKSGSQCLLIISLLIPPLFFSNAVGAAGSDEPSPNDSPTLSIEDRQLKKAQRFVYKEKYDKAIISLKRTTKKYPQNADAWNLLGFSLRKTGDTDGATEAYNKALAIDENHLGALEYQGELFILLGQLDKAKENLAKLNKLCPDGCSELEELDTAIDSAN